MRAVCLNRAAVWLVAAMPQVDVTEIFSRILNREWAVVAPGSRRAVISEEVIYSTIFFWARR
jgi:hypothetical protein